MYNRTPYNKTTYNRTTSIVFEWLATANAETDTSATLKIIRYLDGSAAAVATASGVFVRVLLPSALAEAEAGSVGDYIRTLFFSALAEAVATASGTGVSTYGSVTMVIEGVNMVAGDELIIDTEHMTVTLNGANIIDRVSDDTGKWCPRPWMGDDMNAYYGTSGNEQWARFKARLSGNEEVFDMDINEARKQLTSCADTGDTPSAWAKEAAEYCKRKGIFNGDGAGNFGWQQPITREAVACIIYRALEAAGALGNLSDV